MKYYVIAGEASGDMHAAHMMKQIRKLDRQAYFRVWGGDRMHSEADEMVKHFRDTSFMGIFKVLWNLRTIRRNFRLCKRDIRHFRPDVLILIDNSGFNLPMARFARMLGGIRIYYYILPQAWAWKRKRVHTIHRWCHRVFAILPFEQAFYKSYGYEVDFVGHPILDTLEEKRPGLLDFDAFVSRYGLAEKPIVALLPGSRKQEISTKLPAMLKVTGHFPGCQFIVAGSETIDPGFYKALVPDGIKVLFGETYTILQNAAAALVTSGTATLETALFKVPQVVCYKPGWVTYHLLKRLIRIRYISMVNLILDRMAVEELIEGDLNEKRMAHELGLLFDQENRKRLLADYQELEEKLGGAGASARVARLMVDDIQKHFQKG